MAESTFEHQVCYIAVRISAFAPNQTQGNIGTGFLFRVPLNDGTERSITLLISNKHVFGNPCGVVRMHINKKTDKGEPDFGNVEIFQLIDYSNVYYPHPDDDVDLASVNVSGMNLLIRWS